MTNIYKHASNKQKLPRVCMCVWVNKKMFFFLKGVERKIFDNRAVNLSTSMAIEHNHRHQTTEIWGAQNKVTLLKINS